jgi:hypothetical protein
MKKKCPDCKGTARCTHCKGTGKYPYGLPSAQDCAFCDRKGNGVCHRCNGKGEVS